MHGAALTAVTSLSDGKVSAAPVAYGSWRCHRRGRRLAVAGSPAVLRGAQQIEQCDGEADRPHRCLATVTGARLGPPQVPFRAREFVASGIDLNEQAAQGPR